MATALPGKTPGSKTVSPPRKGGTVIPPPGRLPGKQPRPGGNLQPITRPPLIGSMPNKPQPGIPRPRPRPPLIGTLPQKPGPGPGGWTNPVVRPPTGNLLPGLTQKQPGGGLSPDMLRQLAASRLRGM